MSVGAFAREGVRKRRKESYISFGVTTHCKHSISMKDLEEE